MAISYQDFVETGECGGVRRGQRVDIVPGAIARRLLVQAPYHAQQQDYKVITTEHHDINREQKKAMTSRTKSMGWSSIQCVIGSARMQGDRIRVRGYAVGERGAWGRSTLS
jgi:hypothetical protein